MFHTFCLFMWCLMGVYGVYADEVKSVSVMEGDSVTLQVNDSDMERANWIQLKTDIDVEFGCELRRDSDTSFQFSMWNSCKFRKRLQTNAQNGSITITNMRLDDSGLYEINLSSRKYDDYIRSHRSKRHLHYMGHRFYKEPISTENISLYKFNVTVYTHLPVPIITRDTSSSSKCVLLCSSVLNVLHVSLSWYKGSSLLSSISVSDLNIRLSLPLEVHYEDTNTHTCVLNHPNRNQSQHLNIIYVCQPCSANDSSCDATEAVIRLVASALVGVAAVVASIVLIYDIKSRREEEDQAS